MVSEGDVWSWYCMVIIMVSFQRAFGFWFWEKWRRKCLNLRFHSQGPPSGPHCPHPKFQPCNQLVDLSSSAIALYYHGKFVLWWWSSLYVRVSNQSYICTRKSRIWKQMSEFNLVHLTLWMYSKLQNFQLIFFLLESLHSESLPPLPRDYIWDTWHKWENSNWMLWIQLNSVVFHLRMPPLLATLCVSGPFHFAPCFIDTVHSTNLRTVHTVNTIAQCTVSLRPLLYRQGEEMQSWTSCR